jgi:WD40 repeat protein
LYGLEEARHRARIETNRAVDALSSAGIEAPKLVALAQVQHDTDPTEALAFATASLEVAENPAARSMVMRTLWEAPPAIVLDPPSLDPEMGEWVGFQKPRFSPQGGRISFGGPAEVVPVWLDSGEGPILLRGAKPTARYWTWVRWVSESVLATGLGRAERIHIWSIPEGRLIRTIELGGHSYWSVAGNRVFSETLSSGREGEGEPRLRTWELPNGGPEDLGWFDRNALGVSRRVFAPSGDALVYFRNRTFFARPLPVVEGASDRAVGTHDGDDVLLVRLNGEQFATMDGAGETRVWSLSSPEHELVRVIPRPESSTGHIYLYPDPTGRWVCNGYPDRTGKVLLWDLSALPGAQPLELRRSGSWTKSDGYFHPEGDWLAASTRVGEQALFWPLRKAYPSVVKGATNIRKGLAFSPDGRWLAATWPDFRARLFPLPHTDPGEPPVLARHRVASGLVFDAGGTLLTGGMTGHQLSVVPLDGGQPRELEGFESDVWVESLAFSPNGRLVAAATSASSDVRMLRVWNLDTGEVRAFDLPRTGTSTSFNYEDNVQNLWFTDEDTLVTVGATHFLRWNLKDGTSEQVVAVDAVIYRTAAASADVQKVLVIEDDTGKGEGSICDTPELYDLDAGTVEELPSFGDCVRVVALDPNGAVAVTGDEEGIIRVGRIASGDPHLLAGHEGAIEYVAISPDLQWVASVGADSTLRLWPMPDLDQPPLHTLPRDELLAKLHTLTNLRAVRDDESTTGWTIEVGPFPGWATVPTW